MPDDTGPIYQTHDIACTPTSPPSRAPGADTSILPENVIKLQKEMNKAMGCLLMTKSSLDACWRKWVSDFKVALHQNEAEATKAIREAKAHCGATISEADACFTTHVREAEANCTSIIMGVEAPCTAGIRKVESHCAEHAHFIQQLHGDGMQHLEVEAMEEEERDHLSFLAACGMALQVCPLEACEVLMGAIHLLMQNMSLATLLAILPQVSSTREESTLAISHATTLATPTPSLGTKWWHHLHNCVVSSPLSEDEAVGTSEEPPHLRWKDEMPFKKSLTGSWWEAFAKDSDLVWQAREDYFKTNCPHFGHKTLHDLCGVFQDMIAYADLLGSQIYEIQEVWTGWEDLWYANNALKTLPMSLQFFCPIPPSESSKVMGLTGIHNLEALHCFASMTFYPWCRKEGQNEEIAVNHLWTTHYKLGLVYEKCFHCPSITLEAIWHHGQSCKQLREEDGGLDDTSSSV